MEGFSQQGANIELSYLQNKGKIFVCKGVEK